MNICLLNITYVGVRKENPMPLAESDQLLAEEFADFFIEKIDKIQQELDHSELYELTTMEQVVARQSFLPMTASDLFNMWIIRTINVIV